MYCSNCGVHISEESSFCPNCGVKIPPQNWIPQTPTQQVRMPQVQQQEIRPGKKRRGLGCLITAVIILLIIGAITAIATNSQPQTVPAQGKAGNVDAQKKSAEDLLAQGLAFDARSWKEYLVLYKNHQMLAATIDAYSDGKVSKLDFYDFCKSIEKASGQASISFNYAKTEDEINYLSTLSTLALADQSAAGSLMKYLDSGSTKDLSKAKENINRAQEAARITMSNRIVFLKRIGHPDEKVKSVAETAVAELEKINKEVTSN